MSLEFSAVFANPVQADAAVSSAMTKLPSLIDGSSFPNAMAELLDLGSTGAAEMATAGSVTANAKLTPNVNAKKRPPIEETPLAFAVPAMIPIVAANLQPALPVGCETTALQGDNIQKTDAAADATSPTQIPQSKGMLSPFPSPPSEVVALRSTAVPFMPGAESIGLSSPPNELRAHPVGTMHDSGTDQTSLQHSMTSTGPDWSEVPTQEPEEPVKCPLVVADTGSAQPLPAAAIALTTPPADSVKPGEEPKSWFPASPSADGNDTVPEAQLQDLPQKLPPDIPSSSLVVGTDRGSAASGRKSAPSAAMAHAASHSPSADAPTVKTSRHAWHQETVTSTAAQWSNPVAAREVKGHTPPVFSDPVTLTASEVTTPFADAAAIDPGESLSTAMTPANNVHPAAPSNASAAAIATAAPMPVAAAMPTPEPVKPAEEHSATALDNPLAAIPGLQSQPAANPRAAARPVESAPEPSAHASLSTQASRSPLLQTARIIEAAGQSEMHIGLRTQAFGSVEVHTAMRATQVGVAVSSEKGDLRGFLQPDLPALQSALQQHDLRFENIRFLHSGVAYGSDSSSSPDSRHQNFAPRGAPSPALAVPDSAMETDEISSSGLTRLSVHA